MYEEYIFVRDWDSFDWLNLFIYLFIIYSAIHKKYNNVNISKRTLRECQL